MKTFEEINKEKWDKNHESLAVDSYVTVGSYAELNPYHDFGTIFDSNLITDKTILDIGVGHGRLLEHFKSLGNRTIGCDISEVAIDRVSKTCDETYLSKDLASIEPVDLAVCHLAIQHNHEAEVFRILNEVQLKPEGVFTFQFASLAPGKSTLSELIAQDINKSMLYFYSAEKMKSLIEESNKQLIKEAGPHWFDEPFNFEWYIFKVKNK